MSNEILSDAINTIDLLQSIYFDKEFEFQRNEDEAAYTMLQGCWESDTWPTCFDPPLPSSLAFTIKAPVELPDQELDEEDAIHLVFNGQLSLTSITDYQLTLPSAANLWLSREDHETLVNTLNNEIQLDSSDDRSTWIIEKMQQLQSIAEPYALAKLQKSKEEIEKAKLLQEGGPVRFLRDWIWFPMIYTREKRGDIIDWAPKYNITGFLCPGKPGAMCLEGPEKKVIQFVNDIKTISWASINPSHRKMTSRWKQTVDCSNDAQLNAERLFEGMTEIKFDIHGKFSNHNDLSKLQSWLKEKGCGEAFDHLFEYDS
ncbi:hypothetical protein V8B55DRAFT_1527813, partial [Mucor lusitanicus]|uniref:Small nuclear ribonucleoprotein Prp3 C-terminal domain-containing protein n=2 Tax=Mucor circinelloides f. lusitanicus TaxID=29924 RepID=A0A162YTD0_MUCCL|nr:hypothetical protein MUCCIDRAFT_85924 [Mucor lusitanicus CBS 277.49]